MAHFEPIPTRVLKKDRIVTRFIIHRSFDIACAIARRDLRDSIHVRRTFRPERDAVFVGKVTRRLGHAEEFRGCFAIGFKLNQPSTDTLRANPNVGRSVS